jgi:hypothetical protein
MLHPELYERLTKKHPQAVMLRAVLEQALPASLVDEVFDRVANALASRMSSAVNRGEFKRFREESKARAHR